MLSVREGESPGGAMALFSMYEGKLIRLTDDRGNTVAGVADTFAPEYGLRAFGVEEEGIRIGGYAVCGHQIRKIELLPTCEETAAAISPGRYRHFKGNEYEVIGVARHSETGEPMVVYKALDDEGGVWVCPARMWNETVERDGRTFKRFCRLDRIERVEKYERLFDEVTACPDEEKIRLLEAYCSSGEWREDYEADERGEFPPDLKRGVLSQDGLYDLLDRVKNGRD